MKLILTFAACFAINFSLTVTAQPVKIMVVTGGHTYDTLQFFQMFRSLKGVEFKHYNQPEANQVLTNGIAEKFDVLVFYDMWQTISDPEKEAYIKLTRQGKPFLFLHHSLVSYQQWTEFENLLGGRYIENSELPGAQQSTYKHDVWVNVEIVANDHPVTRGIKNFRLFDEVYGNFRILPQVKPLIKTNHPQSTGVIGWENRYNSSLVIYLQPGHNSNAYNSENYRKLILQSINYLSGNE